MVHLLVVEDDAGDLRLLEEHLKDGGIDYELDLATTAKEGISKAADGGHDVILLDMGLPDSQGLPTVEAVLAADLDVPIVVVTGLDDPEVGLEAISHGAVDYLVKGRFDGDQLAGTIGRALARGRIQKAVREQGRLGRGEALLLPYEGSGLNALAGIVSSVDHRTVVVATADHPAASIQSALGDVVADVQFVDCCGATDAAAQHANITIVDSPTRLESIAMRTERLCANGGPDSVAVILGLDTLAMYSSPDMVREFSHFLANRFRSIGFTCYLMARKGGNMMALAEGLVDGTLAPSD